MGAPVKHNKKRNVGLLSEFFSRYIARSIISKDYDEVKKAKFIWRNHFKPSKELQKEHALFNALFNSKVKNKEVAHSLMSEVKQEVKKQNSQNLENEKTNLIRDINTNLKPSFFNEGVAEYKTLATLQVLFNSWRNKNINESINEKVAHFEDVVLEHMMHQEDNSTQLHEDKNAMNLTQDDIDGMVVKLMYEKLNSKYFGVLTERQRNLLKQYAFSSQKDAADNLVEEINALKNNTSKLINEELRNSKINESVDGKASASNGNKKAASSVSYQNKLKEVQELFNTEFNNITSKHINENTMAFFMSVSNLYDELRNKE